MVVLLASTATHVALAIVLFFCVNWIGRHAVDFGYASTTLFEDVTENVALNFFLRAMSPAIFIIAVSAISVAIGYPEWRFGTIWVVIYYYLFRALVIFLLNRQRLVSWSRFIAHAVAGVLFAWIAYQYLIIPNRSLLPNVDQMGNELWLAILAFLYAVANKVPVEGGPTARRRNGFVAANYGRARTRFGKIIKERASDEKLELIIYSVLIFEDYSRPSAVRHLERLMFWKRPRTTGIMQVATNEPLSDLESVVRGADLLARSWASHAGDPSFYNRTRLTVADYNADDNYIGRVWEVMEILALRVDRNYRASYDEIWAS